MKQILSFFTAALLLCCSSCNSDNKTASETKDNSAAQKNLAASHIVSKAFETGDPSKIDSAVASDFVDHNERGGTGNRDSLKAMIIAVHKEDPGGKMELIKELADDDYVFSLMRFHGTSNGSMGMPAGPYDMHAIQVVKFKDGMAVEHWEYMMPDEMMKMMAKMPHPSADKMEDSKDKMKSK
jgi:predicted SnoaL-like aldol condensation-catalyzing enzyme